jgi:hypothetical protein
MINEKLLSPSTHSLIVLVARSGWPFVCASRALFLLTLSLFPFFQPRGWSMAMVK